MPVPRWNPAALLFLLCLVGCGGPASGDGTDITDVGLDGGGDGTLVLGTNPTGLEDPTLFEPLASGDDLEIELGFQGLWMVVLALQTQDVVTGLMTVEASVVTEGTSIGEFGIAKQLFETGVDGRDYYLNLFLVVSGPESVGHPATVSVTLTDPSLRRTEARVEVVLTGGIIPEGRTPRGADAGPTDAEGR
ncbi:MAG: hypothetical protein QF464_12810 [Myxococcota bacterium]|nr:hypothetical protein [Myxococcota bacterium]